MVILIQYLQQLDLAFYTRNPDSAGVPQSIAQEVITVPFNNVETLKEALDKWGHEVAAILVEPIVGNFGIVEPKPGFLEKVNELVHEAGALVIYDEVITAFRFMYGGAQDLLGVTPDLTALGKVIGGGLPIGAYGGKKEIMEQVAPLGPAYQAGTMAEILLLWHLVLLVQKFFNKKGFMRNQMSLVQCLKRNFRASCKT